MWLTGTFYVLSTPAPSRKMLGSFQSTAFLDLLSSFEEGDAKGFDEI
jgi:hypothetical protein